jgi:hypothetical protein
MDGWMHGSVDSRRASSRSFKKKKEEEEEEVLVEIRAGDPTMDAWSGDRVLLKKGARTEVGLISKAGDADVP